MNIAEITTIVVAFVTVGGAIVGIVRWLDKGQIMSDINGLKIENQDLQKQLASLREELKENAKQDRELEKNFIALRSSYDNVNRNVEEMKGLLEKLIEKLETRQDTLNKISQKVAILEEKQNNS